MQRFVLTTLLTAIAIFSWCGLPNSAQASPKLIRSFLADSGKADSAKPRSSQVVAGEVIHFYFKVGPLQTKRGKGAPYKTRMIVKKGGRLAKDFGWQPGNAATKSQMKTSRKLKWYHNVMWSLSIPKQPTPAKYEAIITYRDTSSGKEIHISYPYTVVAAAKKTKKIKKPIPWGKTVSVSGRVTQGKRHAANTPVRAYLVSDLAQKRIVLVAETKTNTSGKYKVKLPPDSIYIIKAGVSEQLWRKGKGLHGGTIIDLHFPEEAQNANIPLENPR